MKNAGEFLKIYKTILFRAVGIMLSAVYATQLFFAVKIYPAYSFGNILLSQKTEYLLRLNITPVILLSVAFLYLCSEQNRRGKLSRTLALSVGATAFAAGYYVYCVQHTSEAQYQAALLIFAAVPYALISVVKAFVPAPKKHGSNFFFILPILLVSAYFLYLALRYELYRRLMLSVAAPIYFAYGALILHMNYRKETKLRWQFLCCLYCFIPDSRSD